MTNPKTSFHFENGKISEIEKSDTDAASAAVIHQVKFALSPIIVRKKLSGKISVEMTDGKMHVDYDVTPKEYEDILQQELKQNVL